MKISSNWLNDYISTELSANDVADKLTHTGLEVEEIEQQGFDFEGIVAGKVLSAEKHPNADRLTVCSVDIGSETLPIVCGAPNVAAGQTVAVATVNSVLPVELENGKPLKIKKSKIRGEVSQGMICAEDELGISENHEGIMVLSDDVAVGTPLKEVFGSSRDHVIEIGLTPNRPDASCHVGCARDLHAVTGEDFTPPEISFIPAKEDLGDDIKVSIKDADKCHRYVALMVDGITVSESPTWLKQRLTAIGVRPINNIVDATNYVLHELGQPLHAFDYDLLKQKHITVQSFAEEKKFTTLDDIERKIPASTLFICDGDQPVALAGIMGGQNSEINDNTQTVLIESAWFEPVGIRKSSKKLTLQTDSSYRFERGVDPLITRIAAIRCAELITELAGGTIRDGIVDEIAQQYQPRTAILRYSRLTEILGTEIPQQTTKEILTRLGFELKEEQDSLVCEIPSWRPDVNMEIDLIEEVARIYDYNNIPNPDHLIIRDIRPVPHRERFREKIRATVRGQGYREIYTNSLLPESFADTTDEGKLIRTLNPITRDQSIMRPTLEYGFLRSVSHNEKRKVASMRFFEIGDVFEKTKNGRYVDGVEERSHLLIGLAGQKHPEHWLEGKPRTFSVYDLKADVEAILASLGYPRFSYNLIDNQNLEIVLQGSVIGRISHADEQLLSLTDTDTETYVAELNLEMLMEIDQRRSNHKYSAIPKFPSFEFDLAVVVDSGLPVGDLETVIHKTAGKLLQHSTVFDVFEGGNLEKGKKNVAFRLQFLSEDKTLTISDVDPIIQKILKQLNKLYAAELRS